MTSLLELQDLYNEALVREIIEKTKSAGLVWNHLGGTQFSATEIQTGIATWDFFITKTQIGNLSYKYTLDIKKQGVAYITLQDGALVHTERSSVVKELYEIIEVIVLQLDQKLKETIQFIQQIDDYRS